MITATKRAVVGAVAGGMVMPALSYLLWDSLLAGIFAEWSERDVTNWWWVAVTPVIGPGSGYASTGSGWKALDRVARN